MAAQPGKSRSLPLRWKLVAMMLAVTLISLVVLGAGLLLRERRAFERETAARLSLLADVIGLNSTAALAFNDPAAARETLAALASDPHVMAGVLYDAEGRPFARYRRPDAAPPLPGAAPGTNGMAFSDDTVALAQTIELSGQPIGKVYLMADTARWGETLQEFGAIVGALFASVLAIGFLVSTWLQRIVTEPIAELLAVMRRAGRERNFALRARQRARDEIGFLVLGFNRMLEEMAAGRAEIEQAHDELHKLNAELEQRVTERTAQLEAANRELESFSYSVSHDLRAPLRAIDGFSAALMEDYAHALDDEGKGYLQRVRAGCQRMGLLIDDLLALARVIRHDMRSEAVDLAELARTIVEQLAQAQPERQVTVSIPETLPVRGDPGLLRIALENLLNNAWKFTRRTPNAHIELCALRANGETVYRVRDNGAGFDMAYVEKLFRAFQRLHDAATYPGTGIGLATVERIIHRHGGRIWAEGAVEQGASFYFTLKEVA